MNGMWLMIHLVVLKLNIAISTVNIKVKIVPSVVIGTRGFHIPTYPPKPAAAVCASAGNPVEFGSIYSIPLTTKYPNPMKALLIMCF